LILAAAVATALSLLAPAPARTLVAAGDIASCRSSGDEQTAALVARTPGTVAALGDIVYDAGSTAEFRDCYSWRRFRGRTLLLLDISAVLHKWLHKSVPFDVVEDFAPVAQVATTPLLLFAHPSLPVADVKELIAYARANPGKLSVGTPGVGSPHHLAAAMLNSAAKIDITHVPYRGTAPALNDLLGGQIPLIWATPNAVIQFVETGKVKALATASAQRIAILPQVPTIAENALPGFDVGVWFAIAAPAKTPRDIVERVGKEIGEITRLPDVQKRLSPLGYDLHFAGSEKLRDLIVTDHTRYGTVIRDAGIAPN